MRLSKKGKKRVSVVIKGAILLLAFTFIYQKLNNNTNLANFTLIVQKMNGTTVKLVVFLVFLLMILNWLLEAVKWQFLVSRVEKIAFPKAVASVFCGLTWAVFTPNRVGEYGGRVFFLSPHKRWRGIVAMGVGGSAQFVLTNVLGGLALAWFIGRFIPLNGWLHYAIDFIILAFCSFLLLFYFNIRLLDNFLSGIPFLKPFHRFFIVLTYYDKASLFRIFLLSLSRFAVFTFQYYLVIHLFIPELAAAEIVLMVFIILFVQSSIPSVNLLDVGIRSMTATYFFGYITHHDIAIMASTAFIWLVNLIIPAIVGSVFVLKLKFFDAPAH